MEKQSSFDLFLNHKWTTVQIPGGLQAAHGIGLDGVTPVRSLSFGRSPKHLDKTFGMDVDGNPFRFTSDELLALLRRVEPGYEFIAVKKP